MRECQEGETRGEGMSFTIELSREEGELMAIWLVHMREKLPITSYGLRVRATNILKKLEAGRA